MLPFVRIALVAVLIGIPLLVEAGAPPIPEQLDFGNYGLEDPTADSCGTVRNAFTVDQMFDTTCFPRLVYCDDDGLPQNSTECPEGYTFIPGSTDCFTTANVMTQCGVSIKCGLEGITVYVSYDAVFNQNVAPLQFGSWTTVDSQTDECIIYHDIDINGVSGYKGTLSFDNSAASGPTLDRCGIAAPSISLDAHDGYSIKYNFVLMRWIGRSTLVDGPQYDEDYRVEDYDSESGAVITREKCFMVNAQCNYNPDGTVSSSYQPSTPNALDEHDENILQFEMKPIDCTNGNEISPVTVFVDEDVCFVNKITTDWHDDIRISSTKCWVTPTSDPDDTTYYRLTTHATEHEDTFDWLCSSDSAPGYQSSEYKEAFKFRSFRFQEDTKVAMQNSTTYAQQLYVHCDVNACEDGAATQDVTSTDCVPHCTGRLDSRRARRAASDSGILPTLTKTRTLSSAIVMPKQVSGAAYVETPASSFNLLSDTLSLGLFAVGCVFGVVALGMFIVLKRQTNAIKYRMMNNQ